MTGRHHLILHCPDPTCPGWDGVNAVYTGDTWTEPGWTEPEECPTCHQQLVNVNERIDLEAATNALLDALDEHLLLPRNLTQVDERALMEAILAELRRQARVVSATRKTAAPDINAEFPPNDPPAWLAGGTTR